MCRSSRHLCDGRALLRYMAVFESCQMSSVLICLLLSLRFVGKVHEGNILLRWILTVQEYRLGTVTSEQRCTYNLPVIV